VNLQRTAPPNPYDFLPGVPSFTVTSEEFADGQPLDPAQVHDSADGGNISPSLAWTGAPEGTKSFAITCYDPDAPTISGWWHWLVADIPADVSALPAGAGGGTGLPDGAVQFRTDYGIPGYQGSAPPPGDHPHRYYFVVHALGTDELGLGPDTPAAIVGFHLTMHALARATIVGTYQR
jgi:Raf kinase inhibitor-like YbhB/YbcL family protein